MAGVKGRSGGHNRRAIEAHILAGTFRKDRHGVPPRATTATAPAMRAPDVPAAVLDGLQPAGRGFVMAVWPEYEWSPAEATLLRMAATLVDDALSIDPAERRQAVRLFSTLVQQLGLVRHAD